jgi:pyrimidine deaminase RibD-like protein
MKSSDFEIHNRGKLDKVLVKLCELIIDRQKHDGEKYGLVGACIIDPDNNMVAATSKRKGDKMSHAEREAMDLYESKYSEIPEGSIIVTTLSPCNEQMSDRYSESCTDLINDSIVRKVYCGYTDPTQTKNNNKFTEECTSNEQIRALCKKISDTFLK